eukprot:Rmarinus@m.14287
MDKMKIFSRIILVGQALEFASHVHCQRAKGNVTLFHRGDKGDLCYVLLSGEVMCHLGDYVEEDDVDDLDTCRQSPSPPATSTRTMSAHRETPSGRPPVPPTKLVSPAMSESHTPRSPTPGSPRVRIDPAASPNKGARPRHSAPRARQDSRPSTASSFFLTGVDIPDDLDEAITTTDPQAAKAARVTEVLSAEVAKALEVGKKTMPRQPAPVDLMLHAGASFGEMALLDPQARRAATCVTKRPCLLLTVHRDVYVRFHKALEDRELQQQIERLSHVGWLAEITKSRMAAFLTSLKPLPCPPLKVLYREGDVANNIYIVMSGTVVLSKHVSTESKGLPLQRKVTRKNGCHVEVALVGEGEVLGSECLLPLCVRRNAHPITPATLALLVFAEVRNAPPSRSRARNRVNTESAQRDPSGQTEGAPSTPAVLTGSRPGSGAGNGTGSRPGSALGYSPSPGARPLSSTASPVTMTGAGSMTSLQVQRRASLGKKTPTPHEAATATLRKAARNVRMLNRFRAAAEAEKVAAEKRFGNLAQTQHFLGTVGSEASHGSYNPGILDEHREAEVVVAGKVDAAKYGLMATVGMEGATVYEVSVQTLQGLLPPSMLDLAIIELSTTLLFQLNRAESCVELRQAAESRLEALRFGRSGSEGGKVCPSCFEDPTQAPDVDLAFSPARPSTSSAATSAATVPSDLAAWKCESVDWTGAIRNSAVASAHRLMLLQRTETQAELTGMSSKMKHWRQSHPEPKILSDLSKPVSKRPMSRASRIFAGFLGVEAQQLSSISDSLEIHETRADTSSTFSHRPKRPSVVVDSVSVPSDPTKVILASTPPPVNPLLSSIKVAKTEGSDLPPPPGPGPSSSQAERGGCLVPPAAASSPSPSSFAPPTSRALKDLAVQKRSPKRAKKRNFRSPPLRHFQIARPIYFSREPPPPEYVCGTIGVPVPVSRPASRPASRASTSVSGSVVSKSTGLRARRPHTGSSGATVSGMDAETASWAGTADRTSRSDAHPTAAIDSSQDSPYLGNSNISVLGGTLSIEADPTDVSSSSGPKEEGQGGDTEFVAGINEEVSAIMSQDDSSCAHGRVKKVNAVFVPVVENASPCSGELGQAEGKNTAVDPANVSGIATRTDAVRGVAIDSRDPVHEGGSSPGSNDSGNDGCNMRGADDNVDGDGGSVDNEDNSRLSAIGESTSPVGAASPENNTSALELQVSPPLAAAANSKSTVALTGGIEPTSPEGVLVVEPPTSREGVLAVDVDDKLDPSSCDDARVMDDDTPAVVAMEGALGLARVPIPTTPLGSLCVLPEPMATSTHPESIPPVPVKSASERAVPRSAASLTSGTGSIEEILTTSAPSEAPGMSRPQTAPAGRVVSRPASAFQTGGRVEQGQMMSPQAGRRGKSAPSSKSKRPMRPSSSLNANSRAVSVGFADDWSFSDGVTGRSAAASEDSDAESWWANSPKSASSHGLRIRGPVAMLGTIRRRVGPLHPELSKPSQRNLEGNVPSGGTEGAEKVVGISTASADADPSGGAKQPPGSKAAGSDGECDSDSSSSEESNNGRLRPRGPKCPHCGAHTRPGESTGARGVVKRDRPRHDCLTAVSVRAPSIMKSMADHTMDNKGPDAVGSTLDADAEVAAITQHAATAGAGHAVSEVHSPAPHITVDAGENSRSRTGALSGCGSSKAAPTPGRFTPAVPLVRGGKAVKPTKVINARAVAAHGRAVPVVSQESVGTMQPTLAAVTSATVAARRWPRARTPSEAKTTRIQSRISLGGTVSAPPTASNATLAVTPVKARPMEAMTSQGQKDACSSKTKSPSLKKPRASLLRGVSIRDLPDLQSAPLSNHNDEFLLNLQLELEDEVEIGKGRESPETDQEPQVGTKKVSDSSEVLPTTLENLTIAFPLPVRGATYRVAMPAKYKVIR